MTLSSSWAAVERNPDLPFHTFVVDQADGRCVAALSTFEEDTLFVLEVGTYLPNEIFAQRNEIRAYEIVKKTTQEELIDGKLHRTTLVEVALRSR